MKNKFNIDDKVYFIYNFSQVGFAQIKEIVLSSSRKELLYNINDSFYPTEAVAYSLKNLLVNITKSIEKNIEKRKIKIREKNL